LGVVVPETNKQTKFIKAYYTNSIPPTPIAVSARSKAWNCGH